MKTVSIRDLKEHATEILRHVRENGQIYEVTYRGQVVAHVIPAGYPTRAEVDPSFWKEWQELAERISATWPEDVSALDAIREDRRNR